MSFLDNLEDNLKSLERQQETSGDDRRRQEEERARALAAAPLAEKLKDSDFTKRLMDEAVLAGHRLRTKVYITWLGSTLRLEARERRLELRPGADGIDAVFLLNAAETATRRVDLAGDAAALIGEWLA
jgi:hypothetical protein